MYPYQKPQWQDLSNPLNGNADDETDIKAPVCFTSGTKIKLSATFAITPPLNDLQQLPLIKGDGPSDLDFPEVTAVLNGNELKIDNESSNPLPGNIIDMYDPLEIIWKASYDDGKTWVDVGKAKICYM